MKNVNSTDHAECFIYKIIMRSIIETFTSLSVRTIVYLVVIVITLVLLTLLFS